MYPLIQAAISGDLAEVEQCLRDHTIDIDQQDNFGCTAFYRACEHNHHAIAKLLFTQGANLTIVDNKKWSALHIACQHGHFKLVEWFLLAVSRQNSSDKFLEILNQSTDNNCDALILACQSGHKQIALHLLLAGISVTTTTTDVNKVTALHMACIGEHVETAEMLIKRGANLNQRNGQGYLPIEMTLCQHKNEFLTSLLLEYGADPNLPLQAPDRNSPLEYAVTRNLPFFVKLLLKYGAGLNKDNGIVTVIETVKISVLSTIRSVELDTVIKESLIDFYNQHNAAQIESEKSMLVIHQKVQASCAAPLAQAMESSINIALDEISNPLTSSHAGMERFIADLAVKVKKTLGDEFDKKLSILMDNQQSLKQRQDLQELFLQHIDERQSLLERELAPVLTQNREQQKITAEQQSLLNPESVKIFYNRIEQILGSRILSAMTLIAGMMPRNADKVEKAAGVASFVVSKVLEEVPLIGGVLSSIAEFTITESVSSVREKKHQQDYEKIAEVIGHYDNAFVLAEKLARAIAMRYKKHIVHNSIKPKESKAAGENVAMIIYSAFKSRELLELRTENERIDYLIQHIDKKAQLKNGVIVMKGSIFEVPIDIDALQAQLQQQQAAIEDLQQRQTSLPRVTLFSSATRGTNNSANSTTTATNNQSTHSNTTDTTDRTSSTPTLQQQIQELQLSHVNLKAQVKDYSAIIQGLYKIIIETQKTSTNKNTSTAATSVNLNAQSKPRW